MERLEAAGWRREVVRVCAGNAAGRSTPWRFPRSRRTALWSCEVAPLELDAVLRGMNYKDVVPTALGNGVGPKAEDSRRMTGFGKRTKVSGRRCQSRLL